MEFYLPVEIYRQVLLNMVPIETFQRIHHLAFHSKLNNLCGKDYCLICKYFDNCCRWCDCNCNELNFKE